jgi:hypothetical protein
MMSKKHDEPHVLYVPDSPNVGAAEPEGASEGHKRFARREARADDLAAKVAMADELSGYEKVAGRGVPET